MSWVKSHLRLVEAVAAASSIPLMIYSTWWQGGLDMDAAIVRRLADLPNVQALKWSAPTYDRFTDGVVAGAERLVVIESRT